MQRNKQYRYYIVLWFFFIVLSSLDDDNKLAKYYVSSRTKLNTAKTYKYIITMKHLLISLLLLSSVNISAQTTVVKRQQKQQTSTAKQKPSAAHIKSSSQLQVALPDMVDLGLSVYWANFNVGASASHEYGFYFQWGDTKIVNDKYASPKTYKYNNKIPAKEISGTKYDAATFYLGRGWRIPTYIETLELMEKCQFEPIKVNGIQCAKVIGPNGNFIILPFSGIRQLDGFSNRHGAAYTTSSCPDNISRIDKDGDTPDWDKNLHNNTPSWLTIYFRQKYVNQKYQNTNELMVYLNPWGCVEYGRVIRPVKSK